ncbi:MAG: HU family DNA-binding protein [Paludibacteraceae bacterium]|nr:HU family DNA-binding protein [Paludibacteraceae bacterium]
MNVKDLETRIARSSGLKTDVVKKLSEVTARVVGETLSGGDSVYIHGFGTFETRSKSARESFNPKSGERTMTPAKNAVKFTVGKTFKEKVKQTESMKNKD